MIIYGYLIASKSLIIPQPSLILSPFLNHLLPTLNYNQIHCKYLGQQFAVSINSTQTEIT